MDNDGIINIASVESGGERVRPKKGWKRAAMEKDKGVVRTRLTGKKNKVGEEKCEIIPQKGKGNESGKNIKEGEEKCEKFLQKRKVGDGEREKMIG